MPRAAKRPCTYPMCPELVDAGRCPKHQQQTDRDRQQRRGPRPYDRRAWRDGVRKDQLAIEPLCRHCRQQGRITAATEVDHIDGNNTNDEPSNRQSLCKPCHAIKTAHDDGSFGRPSARTGGR